MRSIIYLGLGVIFGLAMYKAEAASWFRIFEMFQFQSFHMYGFIGTALVIGVISFQWIKTLKKKDFDGQAIVLPVKNSSVVRYLVGGILFGLGWALAGACPGPIFVLIGAGVFPMLIVALFAILGTYLYGLVKDKLPH